MVPDPTRRTTTAIASRRSDSHASAATARVLRQGCSSARSEWTSGWKIRTPMTEKGWRLHNGSPCPTLRVPPSLLLLPSAITAGTSKTTGNGDIEWNGAGTSIATRLRQKRMLCSRKGTASRRWIVIFVSPHLLARLSCIASGLDGA